MSTVFLTHIPKTAGTSMRRAVLDPHTPESSRHRPSGHLSALCTRGSFDLVEGHFPYGTHHLYGIGDPRYFVMLREPLDRSVSNYYFIKSCDGPSYVHPRIEDVKQNSLVEFYRKAQYQNTQTRFLSGIGWEYAGRHLPLNNRLGQWALTRAKFNLKHRYEAFGLKERFEDSVQVIASSLGVEPEWPEKRHKATPDRPSVEDLPEATQRALRRSNSLDVELHSFAVDLFNRRLNA